MWLCLVTIVELMFVTSITDQQMSEAFRVRIRRHWMPWIMITFVVHMALNDVVWHRSARIWRRSSFGEGGPLFARHFLFIGLWCQLGIWHQFQWCHVSHLMNYGTVGVISTRKKNWFPAVCHITAVEICHIPVVESMSHHGSEKYVTSR